MQAKKRYALLVFLLCAFALLQRIIWPEDSTEEARDELADEKWLGEMQSLAQPFLDPLRDIVHDSDILGRRSTNRSQALVSLGHSLLPPCHFGSCFNFTRCKGPSLKVHIYPRAPEVPNSVDPNIPHLSEAYSKILSAIKLSRYYTDSPSDACLFVLSFDTLDRDPLSGNYVKNLPSKIKSLPPDIWDEGRNHIVFNLYSGTWPDYDPTDLQLDSGIGQAMLAKASSSQQFYRSNFDIALPLFHAELPLEESGRSWASGGREIGKEKYLLTFKGKRYVHGIGSEARNSLYHLHNADDIVILTTCQHGKSWKSLQDDRCPADNANYLKWDYDELMGNATFCLVPRGRRLGSFRFLETLRSGCIPVVLSNGWVLPFSEIIDWANSVVWADEKKIFQIPEMLRSIPSQRILAMKQECVRIYRLYFSSVQKIAFTSLKIVENRIRRWKRSREGVENPFPLASLPAPPSFTVLIYSTPSTPSLHTPNNPLLQLISNLAKSPFCQEIRILWDSRLPLPKLPAKPAPDVNLVLKNIHGKGLHARFLERVPTQAAFLIDDRVNLTTDEINFAIEVWRWFPDRMVGFYGRSHIWDRKVKGWTYTSKLLPHYSMILTDAAIVHKYFLESFGSYAGPTIRRVLEDAPQCDDLFLNFMIAEETGKAPMKVGDRIGTPAPSPHHFRTRQLCFNTLTSLMSYLPLRRSYSQPDPLLFRDPVSISKKLYKQMET